MRASDIKRIREAAGAAKTFAHETALDGCDAGDIDEVVLSIEQELKRPLPNAQTLAMFLNSLVRSLRPQHHGAQIAAKLHEAMSETGIRIESEI